MVLERDAYTYNKGEFVPVTKPQAVEARKLGVSYDPAVTSRRQLNILMNLKIAADHGVVEGHHLEDTSVGPCRIVKVFVDGSFVLVTRDGESVKIQRRIRSLVRYRR